MLFKKFTPTPEVNYANLVTLMPKEGDKITYIPKGVNYEDLPKELQIEVDWEEVEKNREKENKMYLPIDV